MIPGRIYKAGRRLKTNRRLRERQRCFSRASVVPASAGPSSGLEVSTAGKRPWQLLPPCLPRQAAPDSCHHLPPKTARTRFKGSFTHHAREPLRSPSPCCVANETDVSRVEQLP